MSRPLDRRVQPSPNRPHRSARLALSAALALALYLGLGVVPVPAGAQDWSDDDWGATGSTSDRTSTYDDAGPSTRWSLRAGLGFTIDPNDFLLNFELPYRFDQYVSAGPMVQVGLADNRYLVAPTANLTITIPDMPGEELDRFHPMIFAGIGFAVLENEDRGGSNRDAGFLVNTGFGVDYALSPRVSIGSRMILNFLPDRTLDEIFFYSWEILGVKLSF